MEKIKIIIFKYLLTFLDVHNLKAQNNNKNLISCNENYFSTRYNIMKIKKKKKKKIPWNKIGHIIRRQ